MLMEPRRPRSCALFPTWAPWQRANMLLPGADQMRLNEFLGRLREVAAREIGLPTGFDFDCSDLHPFLSFSLNIAGDPFMPVACPLNSREFEPEVVAFFAKDAALYIGFAAFLDPPPAWDFADEADSIAISGHKWIGSPIPRGIVLAWSATPALRSRSGVPDHPLERHGDNAAKAPSTAIQREQEAPWHFP